MDDLTPTVLLDGFFARRWAQVARLRAELSELEETMAEYPDPTTLGDPAEYVGPTEGQGYTLELTFRNGLIRTFEVTDFQRIESADGRQLSYQWAQESLREGDDYLAAVQWDEVIMIVTRSIVPLSVEM